MPPTIDNTTDRAREEGDDADWAQWEQNFRDARPVLPEAAMARIEASIRREAERVAAKPRRPRLRLWILLLVGGLIAINAVVVVILMHERKLNDNAATSPKGIGVHLIEGRFPMDVVIGPPLVAPDRPILPIAENSALLGYVPPETPKTIPFTTSSDLIRAAEKLGSDSLDGWHQIGVLEMHRVAGTPAPKVRVFEPHVDDYHIVAAWRMLPLDAKNVNAFRSELPVTINGDRTDRAYWYELCSLLYLMEVSKTPPANIGELLDGQPAHMPSNLGDQARFDLLVELGASRAQAALDVLTTRSYRSLLALQAYEKWDKRSATFPPELLGISHDLVDRLVALHLVDRNDDAMKLLQGALTIRYLNDPQDLAVLLARLGPEDAWDKLLRPLMENEVAFIQNPPTFDQNGPHANSTAIVESSTDSVKDGVTTYLGPILKLSVGPWRITCDRLTPFRNADHGTLLSGSGKVKVEGVIGLFRATADEVSLNTETGELKLAGHVHLDGWTKASDVKSCTITRTGEVRTAE